MASSTAPGGASYPQHPHQQNQQQLQQSPLTDTDPLVKYQTLLPILKESIANLIKHTMYILQNTSNGHCRQSDVQSLNKCMEDFYNISDQVHHWLVLADSTVAQYLMGSNFSTEVTSSFNTSHNQNVGSEKPKDILFYSQFLKNAKKQVKASMELRNMLSEFADEL